MLLNHNSFVSPMQALGGTVKRRRRRLLNTNIAKGTTNPPQPLDVGVFGPMKRCWQKLLTDHKRKTRGKGIDKIVFPRLLKQLSDTSMKRRHFEGAFRESGLYPRTEAAAFPQSKLAPSEAVKKATKSSTNSPRPSEATQSSTNSPRSGSPAVKSHLKHHFQSYFKHQSHQFDHHGQNRLLV